MSFREPADADQDWLPGVREQSMVSPRILLAGRVFVGVGQFPPSALFYNSV